MQKWRFPAGVVPMFQLFILFRLLFSLGTLLNFRGQHMRYPGGWAALVSIIECGLLLVYLSLPFFRRRMGRFFLPVGLMIASLGPWLENLMMVNSFNNPAFNEPVALGLDFQRLLLISSQFQLAFLLFVPQLLISWQYSLRWTLYYNLFLIGLDVLALLVLPTPRPGFGAMTASRIVPRTFLFLLLGFIVNRLSAEQKERAEQLEAANLRLSQQAAALEELATTRERNRLAREIHDTLAHTLSGLAVNLEAAAALRERDPQQSGAILEQSLAVTRSGLVETRRSIQALRATPLEDMGLKLALEALARSCAERLGLKMELQVEAPPYPLQPEVEHCVYRAAEEGLRNIGDHARASRFTLSLQFADRQLRFRLRDDGRGFDPDAGALQGHFGLIGMRERVESLGGAFEVITAPGRGTELVIQLEARPL